MAFLTNKKNAFRRLIFAVIFLSCFPLLCLASSPSQDVFLDLQNIQRAQGENLGKPDWAASGLNLLVPGTGYLYLEQKRAAAAFITTDAVLWGSFFFTRLTSTRRFRSSIGFARTYAHTQSNLHYSHRYWSALSNKNFMNVHELNQAFQTDRDFDLQFLDESEFFSWDSEQYRDRYAQMRSDATNWRTASTLMLGALALNRAVSFVVARVSTKRYNDKIYSAPLLAPVADFNSGNFGVSLIFWR